MDTEQAIKEIWDDISVLKRVGNGIIVRLEALEKRKTMIFMDRGEI